tara:strand:- start:88 stop:312 length:225 start_codon:yes stop_codon:yes gene_type:complete
MSYDKFLRETSGMGRVPGAKGGVRGRRTRGRKGFMAEGKGKDHFPSRSTQVQTGTNPRTGAPIYETQQKRRPGM